MTIGIFREKINRLRQNTKPKWSKYKKYGILCIL